jgi:hypothetical protein
MPPPRAKKAPDTTQEEITQSVTAPDSDPDNNTSALLTQQFSATSLPDIDEQSEVARNSPSEHTASAGQQTGQNQHNDSQNQRSDGRTAPANREIDHSSLRDESDRILRVVQPACDYIVEQPGKTGQKYDHHQAGVTGGGAVGGGASGQKHDHHQAGVTVGGVASGQSVDSDDDVKIYEARAVV